MSTTRAKFISKCQEIVDAKPEYKLGRSDKKQCDCIGMVKYGLRETESHSQPQAQTGRFEIRLTMFDGLRLRLF